MVRKLATLAVVVSTLAIAACNTVRGAGEDLKSVSNCTENPINGGQC